MPRRYDEADRVMLDREYDARLAAPGFDKGQVHRQESDRVLASVERIADVVYDDRSGSRLDVYPAYNDSPLFVWIHGGYWRSSTKSENAFVAPGFVSRGISVASVDYTLAPQVTLDEIVRQVRASVSWLHRNARNYGIDANRIHIGGHSAGGHLVGMLLVDDWRPSFDLPDELFGVALSVSGLHDLHPLIHSFVNEPLSLDREAASRNSPLEHLPRHSRTHLIATCGGLESPEFKRQTRAFVDAWTGRGFSFEEVAMPGFHHFDIILELERPGSALFDVTHAGINHWC